MKKVIPILLFLFSSFITQAQNALGVILKDSADTTLDGAVQMFGSYADSIDLDDAKKIANPFSENIAIGRNVTLLAIEKRTTRVNTAIVLWNLKKNHTYTFELGNYDFNYAAVFEDLKTGIVTPYIKDSVTYYTFTTDSICNLQHRFRITFPCVLAIDTTQPVQPIRQKPMLNVYPNPATEHFYITGLKAGRYAVTITGFNFQKVFDVRSDGQKPIMITHNIKQKGLYYVTFENQTKAILIQ